MSNEQRPPLPKSYMPWAILTTLCCCLPLGIVAIIKSAKVNSLYTSGKYTDSILASWKAKHCVLLAFYVGILFEIAFNILTPCFSHLNTIIPLICDAIELLFSNIGIHMDGSWVVAALFFIIILIIIVIEWVVCEQLNYSLLYLFEGRVFIHSIWVGLPSGILAISGLFWLIRSNNGFSNYPSIVFSIWLIACTLYIISSSHEDISLGDIGDKFFAGKGAPQNFEVAAQYYERANNNKGLIAVANKFLNGEGVPVNLELAARYYKQANNGDGLVAVALNYCAINDMKSIEYFGADEKFRG